MGRAGHHAIRVTVQPDRGKLIVRWVEIIGLALGLAALGWVISARVAAGLDQRNWARDFEARLAVRQAVNAAAPAEATGSPRAVGTAGTTSGIIGRLEAPRLGRQHSVRRPPRHVLPPPSLRPRRRPHRRHLAERSP